MAKILLKDGTTLETRQSTEADMPYVLSTITKARLMMKESVAEYAKAILSSSEVIVVHPPEQPDYLLAYCLVADQTMNFIHVKSEWRRLGIATGLMNELAPEFHKILTPDGSKFLVDRFNKKLPCPRRFVAKETTWAQPAESEIL